MKDVLGSHAIDFPDIERPKPKPKKKEGKIEKAKTHLVDRVRVVNENRDGIPGIQVDLWKEQVKLLSIETGISGNASFGKLPDGRYKVQIQVPLNITCPGDRYKEFVIHHPTQPNFFYEFYLVDGRAPVKVGSLDQIRITSIFQQLPDPFEPWQHRFHEKKPILIINTEGHDLREALDDHNYTRVKFLLSNYFAAAVCDGFVDPPTKRELLIYQNRFAARIEFHLGRQFESDLRRLAARGKEEK